MSKKTWILISCLVLSLTLGLGGSLAYLTDTDTKVNTFTMGNVEIEVVEPNGTDYEIKPGLKADKLAAIKNTGSNPAWVWMTISVPYELKDVLELTMTACHGEEDYWADTTLTDEDGNKYHTYIIGCATEPLQPNTELGNWLHEVKMSGNVDIIDGNYHSIELQDDGSVKVTNLNYPAGDFDIVVTGYAVQSEGISSLAEAMESYKGQWGELNVKFENGNGTRVSSIEELADALAAGGNVAMANNMEADATLTMANGATLNGNGKTITSEAKYAVKVVDGTIANVTLRGTSVYGIYRSTKNEGNLLIEGVTVDGPGYALNAQNGKGAGNLEVYNSNLNGWISYTGFDFAKFHNVYFDENTTNHWENKQDSEGNNYPDYYDYLIRPYVETEFSGCWFKNGYCVDLSKLHDGCTVTFTGCVYNDEHGDEQYITDENIQTVINFLGTYDASKVIVQ